MVACHVVANIPIDEIAARPEVNMCPRTIKRWVSRFNLTGFEGLRTLPKSGRNRVTTPEQDAAIVAAIRRHHRVPASTTRTAEFEDLDVGRSTFYNR